MHPKIPSASRLEAPRPVASCPSAVQRAPNLLDSPINVPFFKRPKSMAQYTGDGSPDLAGPVLFGDS